MTRWEEWTLHRRMVVKTAASFGASQVMQV